VNPFSGLKQPLKRNLTLLYGITLGLVLILAVMAIALSWKDAPTTPVITATEQSPTLEPTQALSQVDSVASPTDLPEIPPTPNEVTPSTLGVTSADLHGAQVTLWQPWTGATGEALKAMLADYSRTNQWGITVNVESYEGFGRMDEAMETAIISGTLPDIILDYSYQGQHWDGSGILADLAPYVQDPVWGYTSAEQSDFIPEFWAEDLVSASGSGQARRLGIPFYRSAYVLFYNQSWAHELGFNNLPVYAEDFNRQACAAAEATAPGGGEPATSKGGWLIRSLPGEAAGWIYAFGGGITNPDAPGYLFNTPETRQAFTYLKNMLDKGCAWSDPGVDAQSEFASRGALFVVGSLYDIPAQQEAFSQAGSSDQWVVMPFPSRRQPVVDTYGPSIMITYSTPARQLAAWLVLKWLVYPHNQIDWVKALGVYPTRESSASYLLENRGPGLQWNQALLLLPDAKSEPSLASWSMVRWTLNDSVTALIDPKLKSEQIPALLDTLDSTAEEIYTQVH
jgi:multiple sugar transport system substrate-binding protein